MESKKHSFLNYIKAFLCGLLLSLFVLFFSATVPTNSFDNQLLALSNVLSSENSHLKNVVIEIEPKNFSYGDFIDFEFDYNRLSYMKSVVFSTADSSIIIGEKEYKISFSQYNQNNSKTEYVYQNLKWIDKTSLTEELSQKDIIISSNFAERIMSDYGVDSPEKLVQKTLTYNGESYTIATIYDSANNYNCFGKAMSSLGSDILFHTEARVNGENFRYFFVIGNDYEKNKGFLLATKSISKFYSIPECSANNLLVDKMSAKEYVDKLNKTYASWLTIPLSILELVTCILYAYYGYEGFVKNDKKEERGLCYLLGLCASFAIFHFLPEFIYLKETPLLLLNKLSYWAFLIVFIVSIVLLCIPIRLDYKKIDEKLKNEHKAKRILFVEPNETTFISFRKELFDSLRKDGYDVILCCQKTEYLTKLSEEEKFTLIEIDADLHNVNPLSNFGLMIKYRKAIEKAIPDIILSYTIKPNLYCSFVCKNIPIICNITGLGTAFNKNGILKKMVILLYKISFKFTNCIFFQNEKSLEQFKENRIPLIETKIIPGSGVNAKKFTLSKIKDEDNINFLFASRPIEEKGFDLLLQAISVIEKEFKNARFNFLLDDKTGINKILSLHSNCTTIINRTYNINEVYKQNDFLVSPSYYHEGISNVLLESLACGRPIITTNDNPGCQEILQENINGYGCKSKDLESLIEALRKACKTSKTDIEKMGKHGRDYVVKDFNRDTVIEIYKEKIKEILK